MAEAGAVWWLEQRCQEKLSQQPEGGAMRSTHRRISVHPFYFALSCAAAVAAGPVHAQAYPTRTIEFISHSSAGSGTDLFNRNVTDLLAKEKIFNVPFVNSNRVGGNGVIAYQYVKSK